MGVCQHDKNQNEERERDRGIKELYLDGTGKVPFARNHAGHSPSNTNPNRD